MVETEKDGIKTYVSHGPSDVMQMFKKAREVIDEFVSKKVSEIDTQLNRDNTKFVKHELAGYVFETISKYMINSFMTCGFLQIAQENTDFSELIDELRKDQDNIMKFFCEKFDKQFEYREFTYNEEKKKNEALKDGEKKEEDAKIKIASTIDEFYTKMNLCFNITKSDDSEEESKDR